MALTWVELVYSFSCQHFFVRVQEIKVFNGDADGICALHQLGLLQPSARRARWQLITGVKRDIRLLEKIKDTRGADITVLDISLDANRESLAALLAQDNIVCYIDHHFSGEIPTSPLLTQSIDPSPRTCTSLLVDEFIGQIFPKWALVGAFGDNLDEEASTFAKRLGIEEEQIKKIRELGRLINYNSYGLVLDDLHVAPQNLLQDLHDYADPVDYFDHSTLLAQLRQGHAHDMALAEQCLPAYELPAGRVYILPTAPWANRIVGIFANRCCREEPHKAHAIMQRLGDGSLRVSVRAPLDNQTGADVLCHFFPGGGGRAAAAGINQLPADQLGPFLKLFAEQFPAQDLRPPTEKIPS